MSRLKLWAVRLSTACLLYLSLSSFTTAQDQAAQRLELGKPVERELMGEQAHSYLIELAANDFLHIVVEQRGVDVVVTVYAPDGKKLKEVDSPNGKQGPEPMLLLAETAGAYRLEVRSSEKGAAGNYAITLADKRTATTEDQAQVARQASLEQTRELSNQVTSLYRQGRYQNAIPLAERALAINEKVLGPEHPDAATSLNDLAVLYHAAGDYARAATLFQRTLAIREKVLGPEHPDVATSLNGLASLYRNTGDYTRAAPLFQRALAIREKALGPEHPDVATALNNLALLYHNTGDYTRAVALFQRALAIREKALGPEHPAVATLLSNLALLYRDTGDNTHAAPLFQRALVLQRRFHSRCLSLSSRSLARLFRCDRYAL